MGGDWKALYDASAKGLVEEARGWLSAGADPNQQHPEVGTTPLIAAAENGHLAVVQMLIAHGADPSVRSEWEGHTARQAAAAAGHREVARWLELHESARRG
jgi:ankyrin repeat protein